MAKANIDMLISILMYIDINYMTDDESDSIYELDINDEKNRKDIIRRLIVPGVKSDYSEGAFKRAKEVIVMGIEDIETTTKIFHQMSFPFESDILDKKTFLEIIYQELFEGSDD
ncbi:hypothetical protein [Clostridium gasigenes]|uniref:hypothetical protein n=1 Tax=Clostridium gasigenes TaxID=94869 RepID=UPI001C0E0809|nr:hypothetical protein [Clostridium gasigenes]MBU3104324.1 hypothetical protein [Clostridium gasigenes]